MTYAYVTPKLLYLRSPEPGVVEMVVVTDQGAENVVYNISPHQVRLIATKSTEFALRDVEAA